MLPINGLAMRGGGAQGGGDETAGLLVALEGPLYALLHLILSQGTATCTTTAQRGEGIITLIIIIIIYLSLFFSFFFFFFAFPSYISGVHHFWVRFLRM